MTTSERELIISNKSLFQLQHVFNLIGRRIVPCYFFTHNQQEFMRWQFNACRQTAIICAYFLDKLALRLNYIQARTFAVNAWDSNFSDTFNMTYNHAWAFMDSQENNTHGNGHSEGLFVDVARISYPTAVAWGINNPVDIFDKERMHPISTGINFTEVGLRECLPWRTLLDEKEYYTSKRGWDICGEIEYLLNAYGYDFSKFNFHQ